MKGEDRRCEIKVAQIKEDAYKDVHRGRATDIQEQQEKNVTFCAHPVIDLHPTFFITLGPSQYLIDQSIL